MSPRPSALLLTRALCAGRACRTAPDGGKQEGAIAWRGLVVNVSAGIEPHARLPMAENAIRFAAGGGSGVYDADRAIALSVRAEDVWWSVRCAAAPLVLAGTRGG